MKKLKENDNKKIISITLNKDTIKCMDNITNNRSNLVNIILKEYFKILGEDVSKIKL